MMFYDILCHMSYDIKCHKVCQYGYQNNHIDANMGIKRIILLKQIDPLNKKTLRQGENLDEN